MANNNKQIQRKRMLRYFIKAAEQVIEEEGIDNVTTRKISTLAGYNNATMYNYFEDLNQLINIALIDCVMDYFKALEQDYNVERISFIRLIKTWRKYAEFSFRRPEIYTYVFYSTHTKEVLSNIETYLKEFPELSIGEKHSATTILGTTINERDDLLMNPCIEEGIIAPEMKEYIMDFCYSLHLGMSIKVKNGYYSSHQEAVDRYTHLITDFILSHSKIEIAEEDLFELVSKD